MIDRGFDSPPPAGPEIPPVLYTLFSSLNSEQLEFLSDEIIKTGETITAIQPQKEFLTSDFEDMLKQSRFLADEFEIPIVLTEYFILKPFQAFSSGNTARFYYETRLNELKDELPEKDYQLLLNALEEDSLSDNSESF